jgi:hypothetical protein
VCFYFPCLLPVDWHVHPSRLFFMLRRFPIESKGRRKKLHEVWCISFLLDFCNLESIYHITKHDCCYTMYCGFCLFSYLHTMFACYPLDFSSHQSVLSSLWWIWNHPSHMITYFKDLLFPYMDIKSKHIY